MNAHEATQMIDRAREKKLFLMEAMWTRFRPAIRSAHKLVESGAIGEPELFTVAVGWGSPFDTSSRLFAKELGGGILLDGGIYPISLASHFLGTPEPVSYTHLTLPTILR